LSVNGNVYDIGVHRPGWDVLFQIDGPAAGALAAVDGMVFAAGADGCVHAIDVATRQPSWRLPTDGLVLSAPVAVAGRLYVAGTDGVLREVSLADHRKIVTADIDVPVHAGMVHDQGRLYIGGCDGVLRAYDISHQRNDEPVLLWTCSLTDEISGLAAANGSIYATAGDQVVEIDVTTGRSQPRFRLSCLTAAAPTVSGRSGYVVGLGGLVGRMNFW
jgi:outer membrane protein assembly factor BamB